MRIRLYIATVASFALMLTGPCVYGQTNLRAVAAKLDTLAQAVHNFEVDNLGNLYLVNAQQQIKKVDAQLDSIGLFNDVRRYGKLKSLDVSNPLKILLFYQDVGTVVVLDRFLGIRTTVDLRHAGILQPTSVAQSYDNNIWVFDELDSKLKKVSDNGELLLESPELRLVLDAAPAPTYLVDYNKYLYAYDSAMGLMVFDYFGAYKQVVAFLHWKNLHGFAKGILATEGNQLIYYRPGTVYTDSLPLPLAWETAQKIRLHERKLFALMPNGLLLTTQLSP